MGTELHILGGIEGGKGTADIKNDPAAAGADDWYVKHTEAGYNVEIAFPLEAITGTDANGDKVFSFTAVSTITYGWADPTGQPERLYAFVGNGRGEAFANQNDCKKAPNLVVIKGTATPPVVETPDPTEPVSKTEKGCNVYETVKSAATLTVDGVKDDAYADGIFLVPTFCPAANGTTYNFYMVADETHIYVLYDFDKAEEIFYDANYGSKYHFDCADFLLRLDGAESTGNEFRIHGTKEGGKGEALVFDNADLAAIGIDDYYVKHTAEGYNVEFSIPLEKVTGTDAEGNKVISFTVMATVTEAYTPATQGAAAVISKIYPAVACGNMEIPEGENAANWIKARPNILVVKGTAPVVTPEVEPTEPAGTTAAGNWIYEVTKAAAALAVDGVKDAAYADGVMLSASVLLPADSESGYDGYFAADETQIYVFYEFTKVEGVFYDTNYKSGFHHFDCVDFILNLAGAEAIGTEFRIWGAVEGGVGTALAADTANAGVDNYFVKKTDKGYNVEFTIPYTAITGADAEGNKTISFTAMSTMTTAYTPASEGVKESTTRTYAFVANAKGITVANDAKKSPSLLVVKGTATGEPVQEKTADGRYTYTLNAGKTALAVDGVKDDAYANGLTWEAVYALPTTEDYGYTLYMAADAGFVYMFFDVKDAKVVGAANASAWYRGDCIDLIISEGAKASEGTGDDARIFGDKEGGLGTADARDLTKAPAIVDLFVKKTEAGYAVEVKLDRSKFTDAKVFSFLAMSGACLEDKDTYEKDDKGNPKSCTVYPCIDNAAGVGGNPAKEMLNEVKIVDAQ